MTACRTNPKWGREPFSPRGGKLPIEWTIARLAGDCWGTTSKKRGREPFFDGSHFPGPCIPPDSFSGRGLGGPVVLAGRAVSDVEVVTDDRKPHRVYAKQQLSVRDRVKADIRRN